jgi:hypothetical protein
MLWVRRKRLRIRICLGIGMGAFLWVQGVGGVVMAQAASPPASTPPATQALRLGFLLSRIEMPQVAAASPTFALRIPALSVSSAGGSGETGPPGESKPLYKRGWFLAGLAVLVAGTAVLLASSGGDRERLPVSESLPGFPPPPDLGLGFDTGGSMHCELR